MQTSFLKPVKLPGSVIVRSRVVRKERRKIYVRGTIEDGDGEFCRGVKTSTGREANRQVGNVMTESEAMVVDKTPDKAARL